MIKVLYVVEPMIGIGPNVDANLIAKKVIEKFPEVDLTIVMDTQVPLKYLNDSVRWVQSIPWRCDPITKKLYDMNKNELTEAFKKERTKQLLEVCNEYKPDVLLLHNYASGSRWDSMIDFEMLPLISLAKSINPNVKVYSYLIGMIDSFEGMNFQEEKFFIESVNNNIDKILLRSDNPDLFFKTCPVAERIKDKFIPVGYSIDTDLPKKNIDSDEKFIVVSAGGGDLGLDLFMKSIDTCSFLISANMDVSKYNWKLFLGPMQLENKDIIQNYVNQKGCSEKIEVITNADDTKFLSYLSYNCVVSISQCGQRTFTDLEVSGAVSIVVPRESKGQEFEQLYRAKYMEEIGRAILVHEYDLSYVSLSNALRKSILEKPKRLGLQMNGPENLLKYISSGLV